jgi:hypothetical protein
MKSASRCFGAPAHSHKDSAHADAHGHHDSHHDDHHADHHGDHHDDHGHGHGGPHVPEGYDKAGKFCLLTAYLWVFYKFKEDKGQLFGYYQPWLHEHEHDHHVYESEGTGKAGRYVQHDEHEEDEH